MAYSLACTAAFGSSSGRAAKNLVLKNQPDCEIQSAATFAFCRSNKFSWATWC